MDERFIEIYRRYIAEQCELVILGASTTDYHLKHDSSEAGEERYELIWAGIQMVLTGDANLHKALWGGGRSSAAKSEERRPIREDLGIEATPAISDIAVRNSFEHFDERLFAWYNDSPGHFIDRCIYSQGGIVFQDVDGNEINVEAMRRFDPQTGIVWFRNEKFYGRDVIEEVKTILEAVKQKSRY